MRKAIIFDGALTNDSAGIDDMAVLASITEDGYCVLESMSERLKISIALDRDDVLAIYELWDGRLVEAAE